MGLRESWGRVLPNTEKEPARGGPHPSPCKGLQQALSRDCQDLSPTPGGLSAPAPGSSGEGGWPHPAGSARPAATSTSSPTRPGTGRCQGGWAPRQGHRAGRQHRLQTDSQRVSHQQGALRTSPPASQSSTASTVPLLQPSRKDTKITGHKLAVTAWPPRAGHPTGRTCSTEPSPPCEESDAVGTITVKPLGSSGSNGEGSWVWRSRRRKGGPERGVGAGARERDGDPWSASAQEDRSGPGSAGSPPGPQPLEGAEPECKSRPNCRRLTAEPRGAELA